MTNNHYKKAFEIACEISYSNDAKHKSQLVKQWREAMEKYLAAVAFARAAHD